MSAGQIVKLNYTGPRGEEFFLAVDFSTQKASVIVVETNGNLRVTDVQPIGTRGV